MSSDPSLVFRILNSSDCSSSDFFNSSKKSLFTNSTTAPPENFVDFFDGILIF